MVKLAERFLMVVPLIPLIFCCLHDALFQVLNPRPTVRLGPDPRRGLVTPPPLDPPYQPLGWSYRYHFSKLIIFTCFTPWDHQNHDQREMLHTDKTSLKADRKD